MRWRGRWINRERRDTHTCPTPAPRHRDAPGSVWECRCGQRWRLASNGIGGDGYTQRWRWTAA